MYGYDCLNILSEFIELMSAGQTYYNWQFTTEELLNEEI